VDVVARLETAAAQRKSRSPLTPIEPRGHDPIGTNPALLASPIAGGDDVDAFRPLREPARLVPDFRFDTSARSLGQ
jgi:hypothetical protein